MSRYMLFAGECHYATGGAYELFDIYDDLEDAINMGRQILEVEAVITTGGGQWGRMVDWCHIYDIDKREIVWQAGNDEFNKDYGLIVGVK